MRVITGTARGKRLGTLEGIDVRPTSDRVKEAIFSIIHFDIEGSTVLDLFSGSGQLGIEALSRGAKYATFVDQSRNSVEMTKENLMSTGLMSNSRVTTMNAVDFLNGTKSTFDIAFLDPPYNKGILMEVLPLLEKKMTDGGIVLCEHESKLQLSDDFEKLKFKKRYNYGKIALSLFVVKGEAE